ncbi:DinB family protein [Actinomadura napierensis]|uniref:DinB family protein n=1 Tax=Actinomadura napierensis TaxID=267854 RepID=A0ABN3ACK0_9ACTN
MNDTAEKTRNGAPTMTGERADLLALLAKARHFLRFTVRDLTDDQARRRTTTSELCLGGLIKHVTSCERSWVDFIVEGPSAMPDFNAMTQEDLKRHAEDFLLLPDETLEGVLAAYDETARRTEELIAALPDLDAAQPLPKAPWFDEDASWSARLVLMHVAAETFQHAGHADIIRESLDGAKSMG